MAFSNQYNSKKLRQVMEVLHMKLKRAVLRVVGVSNGLTQLNRICKNLRHLP